MISGLSHITLIVDNLERSASFLKEIFGAEEVYSSGNETFSISPEKFFLIGDIWIVIMEGKPHTERVYNHIAFKINEDDLDDYILRIKAIGADIKAGRQRVAGEGRSIYFYDFDNHLFELHTGTFAERLKRYTQNDQ